MYYKLLVVFASVFFSINIIAQNRTLDLMLIEEKPLIAETELLYYKRAGNNTSVLKTEKKSFLAKVNPLTLTLKAAMFGYQNIISPQLSKSCAYHTTCSNFSKQAIAKFGIIKGVFLTVDRLMRCNRIAVLDVNALDIDETTGTIIDSVNMY
ncbi:MAG TPA: membrane protein insertion efficiency factor YidD [Chitinophagaceae bacterium]|nr:membrane protein insertion efficiency factor YidD [Chitinophagaceae bacterium]